jgi:hypothetical protein
MSPSLHDWPLTGLPADNLLGYLAALGVFRTAAAAWPQSAMKMSWAPHGASWCPILQLPCAEKPALLSTLHTALSNHTGHPALTIDTDLKISLKQFTKFSREQTDNWLNSTDTWGAAMAAAFGCGAIGNDEGTIEDTAFRTMSGAGHQHFLEFMNTLARETTEAQLAEAIFGPWRYRDPSPTLRWDAEDDRRYALRWDEPSKDPVRTVRGANRLAFEALPFFPVVPVSSRSAATTGFTGRRSHDTFVSWPVWTSFLTVDTAAALIASGPDEWTPARGIPLVFRSQRITLGKYRNFTPATVL